MHSAQFTDLSIVRKGDLYITARARRYGRHWALKALKEELRSDETHARLFREEFEFLISLQHPHIVSVVGLEEVEGLGACIVMEWVDGQPLEDWLKDKHPRRERVQIMRQILSAFEYAGKEKGALLCVKPSEVMIARSGVGVKILGFGVKGKEVDGLGCISREMKLGRVHTLIRGRIAVAFFFVALFVACLSFSLHRITADRQTISALSSRLDSAQDALHELTDSKQQLSAFVEGAKRYMESRVRYDLDSLNTYEACEAARKELLSELEKALTDYYAAHPHPAAYAYTYAKFSLMDYRREIIQPLENKRLKLLPSHSSMRKELGVSH